MICFVDEDARMLGAYVAELELRGHTVELLHTASDAWQKLWRARPSTVGLAIIDVMLAPGDGVMETEGDVLTTGLDLLRDLSTQNPTVFPERAVLFTGSIGNPIRAANACAQELGVELWHKSAIVSPVDFGDRVERLIARRADA